MNVDISCKMMINDVLVSSAWSTEESDEESEEEFLKGMLLAIFPRRPKVFRPRVDYFKELRDFEFVDRFRLSKEAATWLVNRIRPQIAAITNRNHAVTPEQKVLLTLRFFATASMLRTCSDFTGIHISTASRIVDLISRSIASLRSELISMPQG